MKIINKILPILLIAFLVVSCNEDDDRGIDFSPETSSGWIEFSQSSTLLDRAAENLSVPVSIRVPIFENGIDIAYEIEAVEGDFTQFISSNSGMIFANPSLNTRIFNIDLALSGTQDIRTFETVFDIVLTSASNGISVGLNDETIITRHRVTIPCNYPVSDTYTGDSYTNDLGIGPNGLVNPYTVTLTTTSCGNFAVDTSWGPEFVSNLCGGCVAVGSFLNSSTLTINDDLSVTVIGENGDGTGTYDPNTNTFTLSIAQALFTTEFNVDVVLTGN